MPIRSMRAGLTLWYTGILAVTFLLLGAAAYLLMARTLDAETDSALRGVAIALAEKHRDESKVLLPPDVEEAFRHFFGSFPAQPYFEWFGTEKDAAQESEGQKGFPLTDEAKGNAMRGLATFETVTDGGQYPVRILTWPVIESGRVQAIVRVGMSQMSLSKAKRQFLVVMAILFPLALMLAGSGGLFLARRAMRPIGRMSDAAGKINADRLHDRLELSGTSDELDRLAATINGMLSRLDTAFTEIRQFTADASHELQTPLTIIRGEMEVALRSGRSPEEYVEVLNSALQEIERISILVEGLLLLARADAGVLRMDRKPIDLSLLAQAVVQQAEPLAEARSIDLAVGEVSPLEVIGDPAHLRRLLLNLVDNGIKYAGQGGAVRISFLRLGSWAVLSVKDSGPGIALEEQQKIFQRFYRSAEARARGMGGSGLGLSIVKSIAEAHGGKVEVESVPGRGSTFKVFLPLNIDGRH